MRNFTLIMIFVIQLPTVPFCATIESTLNKSENDSLLMVELVNEVFLKFLENAIESEKKCNYYSQELMFTIFFQTIDSQKTIQVESVKDVMKLGNELAGFNLNEHVFLILGESLEESIFKKTNSKINVVFFEPSNKIQRSSEIVLDVIEDDSFSVWVLENNGKFNVIDSFSYCK